MRIVSNSSPKKFLKDFKEILLFFSDIEKNLGGFLFDAELGFLAENADNNGFNFKYDISASVKEEKLSGIKSFCGANKLVMNEGVKEIEGQLQKIRVKSKKISVLFEDLEIIGKLIKLIEEI